MGLAIVTFDEAIPAYPASFLHGWRLSKMSAYRARYVFPVDAPPIEDAVVAFERDRFVSVCSLKKVDGKEFATGAVNLGDIAIVPGLVNPHTHLEFSDLERPLGTAGIEFPNWIRKVIEWRSKRRNQASEVALSLGIGEAARAGTTAVGDIASQHEITVAGTDKLEQTRFYEFLGLSSERAHGAISKIISLPSHGTSGALVGISPHAPYSSRPQLISACVEYSSKQCVPLAHHLAESPEELQLLRTGDGPFRVLLEELGAWDPSAIPKNSRPLDYLNMLAEAHRALVIHGNYLEDKEIAFLAEHADRMSVVYCPRTHAYFEHGPYPLAKMLAAGVQVAIGTDSRASSPDLSLLGDFRFAAVRHPQVSPEDIFKMITLGAAQALGRDREIGSITPGKFADLAILKLDQKSAADPYELLLDPTSRIVGTIFRGRPAYWNAEVLGNSPSL